MRELNKAQPDARSAEIIGRLNDTINIVNRLQHKVQSLETKVNPTPEILAGNFAYDRLSLGNLRTAIKEVNKKVENLRKWSLEWALKYETEKSLKPEITLEKVIEFLKKMHFESFGGKGGSG